MWRMICIDITNYLSTATTLHFFCRHTILAMCRLEKEVGKNVVLLEENENCMCGGGGDDGGGRGNGLLGMCTCYRG